ncbi:hypothetical protein Q8A67_002023 [Cirrhinus molitorella]|uniref:RING-type domain-containing protein n=1 Tax=Cirrhinus molitorella TaxID=172907 RepID=A0AA88QJM6_9TELE|nr:hypothetical protein Q8A67_002023 [Cirrhinus molitorella]
MEEAFSTTPPKFRHERRYSIDLPPFMDLHSIPLLTEVCKCPVCLDVFTDPVTTPCGHSFCKSCLTECWDNSQDYRCPYCKETFNERPDLKNNTVLREIVQLSEKITTVLFCKSGPLSEELQCPICLDLFDNPVTTPCGHNFCKTCLETFWDNSQNCTCPFCKETCNKYPDLRCNTTLKNIVQLFEEKTECKREPMMTEYSNPLEIEDQEETLCKPSVMASSSSVLTENQCFICLEVSTDPMMTPCGHNYCRACLKECWESSHDNTCPCCKENFTKRVDLRDIELLSQTEIVSCRSSYNETQLEPHEQAVNIKEVMMIDLEEDINLKIIQKHNIEMVCGDDQMSVWQSYTDEDHKTHNTVLAEDKRKEEKTQEMKIHKLVQHIIQYIMMKNTEIKHSEITMSKKKEEKEKADNIERCTDLNYSTEKCQMTLSEHW